MSAASVGVSPRAALEQRHAQLLLQQLIWRLTTEAAVSSFGARTEPQATTSWK